MHKAIQVFKELRLNCEALSKNAYVVQKAVKFLFKNRFQT